jgi:hypothetical protein
MSLALQHRVSLARHESSDVPYEPNYNWEVRFEMALRGNSQTNSLQLGWITSCHPMPWQIRMHNQSAEGLAFVL